LLFSLRGGKGAPLGRDLGRRIKADRKFGLCGVEVAHVIDARRDMDNRISGASKKVRTLSLEQLDAQLLPAWVTPDRGCPRNVGLLGPKPLGVLRQRHDATREHQHSGRP